MTVEDGAWAEHARRRGRTIAIWSVAGGCGLFLLGVGVLTAAETPSWLRPVLVVALIVPLHLVLNGWRRFRIESSPSLTPPLTLPAVSEPGSFARLPLPRPTFGLRLHFRPLRAAVYLGLIFGIPMIVLGVASGAGAALFFGALWLGIEVWNLNWFLRKVPLEVRVTNTSIEWRASLRSDEIPVQSLRRLRCSTISANAIVLEFEGHPPRLILGTGGFADFLEALTVTCPWVEVSSEVVDRFGSWSGRTNGFSIESLDPATGGG